MANSNEILEEQNQIAEEIHQGIQTILTESGMIKATYKNVRRVLIWIAKQRFAYAKKRQDLWKKHETLSEGKTADRIMRRLLKAESAYHILGVAWYDTLKGAEPLGYLDKLQKDATINKALNKPIQGSSQEDQDRIEKIRKYLDDLLRPAGLGAEVPRLSEPDSNNVGTEQEG